MLCLTVDLICDDQCVFAKQRHPLVDSLKEVLQDDRVGRLGRGVSSALAYDVHCARDDRYVLTRDCFDDIVEHANPGTHGYAFPDAVTLEYLISVDLGHSVEPVCLGRRDRHPVQFVSQGDR